MKISIRIILLDHKFIIEMSFIKIDFFSDLSQLNIAVNLYFSTANV